MAFEYNVARDEIGDKVYYVPDLSHSSVEENEDYYSFMVFTSIQICKKHFPEADVLEFNKDDYDEVTVIE